MYSRVRSSYRILSTKERQTLFFFHQSFFKPHIESKKHKAQIELLALVTIQLIKIEPQYSLTVCNSLDSGVEVTDYKLVHSGRLLYKQIPWFLCGGWLTFNSSELFPDGLKVMLFAFIFYAMGGGYQIYEEVPICGSGTQCPHYSAASLG